MPLFETPRLLVRELSRQDLPALTAILSDPEVMKFSVRGVCDEQMTGAFIDWCVQCYASYGMGQWALVDKANGELVGFCGVSPEQVEGVEQASLGYRLATRYWGQGLASEAVRGVLEHAFSEQRLAAVIAIIEAANIASLRVAQKAGFNAFDTVQFHERPVRVYRLTHPHWKAP
ncbi:Protein N-acetyltransferase, RimJ/RimL family [Pseudomonas sp. UC 17F4]|uniref:GNAT family N-acetyltransferase n=1 Tax=Pseudomonas sp. UC 17F4 TaxID=1855328 RepID=UPI00088F2EAA|nr:GNAT family N-acetyltransferase [Pseudomonas sp. UC 17F4]SDQ60149.1 Protein N-acetyltransferase, RimJ/RimL family [Pseudomonas sp. UC 17F4]